MFNNVQEIELEAPLKYHLRIQVNAIVGIFIQSPQSSYGQAGGGKHFVLAKVKDFLIAGGSLDNIDPDHVHKDFQLRL